MEIKKGAIVWLKSGSPAMTVGNVVRPGTYLCHWFIGTKLEHGQFNVAELTTEEPNNISSGQKKSNNSME